MLDHQMVHLNSNALCAIEFETVGENPRLCDIVEICIILVDNFIKPSKMIIPFYNQIAPFRPENIDYETATATRAKIRDAANYGLEPSLAGDRLEEWHKALDLPNGKKIIPLTYNWPLKREYLHTWLGFHTFNSIFADQYRDLMAGVFHINDARNQRAKQWKYPKYKLPYIANQHKIQLAMSDDIMERALKMIEIYRLMIGVNY